MFKTAIRYAGYPFIIFFPLWLFNRGAEATGKIFLWVSIAIFTGVALMLIFERALPMRDNWKPRWDDVKLDLKFYVFVHLAFAETLGATIAALLAAYFGTTGPLSQPWLKTWPIWTQVMLITVAADFLRYWEHRAMHKFSLLWRLHAVHHSVQKLYMLNALRIHPFEVALQYCVFTLPFMLLGMDQEAIAFGLVIHATMSSVAHTNIDFRFGLLNRVLSTPALHRWHHSQIPAESNANFSPIFCIWDIVFGTYHCPKDIAVNNLGIQDANYPMGFLAQIKAPQPK